MYRNAFTSGEIVVIVWLMGLREFGRKVVDVLFDCSFVEKKEFYMENGELWKEVSFACKRCGKTEGLSEIRGDVTDFFHEEPSTGDFRIEHYGFKDGGDREVGGVK
jgi:hypothetical protein